MRLVSVASLLQQAREWTDTVGAPSPSDAMLLNAANQGWPRLYNFEAQAYGQDWTWAVSYFVTQPNQVNYALPPDFFLMRLVDLQVQPPSGSNPGVYTPVLRYNETQRGNLGWGGQNIDAGLTFRLSYNPTAPVLAQYATLTVNSGDGIDGITFTSKASGPIGANVSIQMVTGSGGATTIAAGSTPYALILTLKSGGDTIQGVLAALAASATAKAVVNAQAASNIQTDTFTAAYPATNLGGNLTVDGIDGLEEYVINYCAAFICQRLGRDGSGFIADKDKLEAYIRDLIETRDVGLPLVAPDNENEEARAYPFGAYPHRYAYTIEGSNIVLLREGWA